MIEFNAGELGIKNSFQKKPQPPPNCFSQLLLPTVLGPASILSWPGLQAFPQPLLTTQLKPLILRLGVTETGSVCSLPLGLTLEPIHSLCCHPLVQPGGCLPTEPLVPHPAWGTLGH